jgi:putative membrane protein
MTVEPEPSTGSDPAPDPTRRTYLAQERTLLAWWRTGLAIGAVGLAVGKIVPEVAHVYDVPYIAVGAAFGLLAIAFVLFGARRDRMVVDALRRGGYVRMSDWAVWLFTSLLAALITASVVLICLHP